MSMMFGGRSQSIEVSEDVQTTDADPNQVVLCTGGGIEIFDLLITLD